MTRRKTIVYIDGFNLYYGVLKKTAYKWLDVQALVNALLTNNDIIEIKYFTAPVKGNENRPLRRTNQKAYTDALQAHIPHLQIIEGYYISKQKTVKNLNPPPYTVEAIIREEKGTDVNIAVEIVKDSLTREFDCVVLISNDSDLARSIKIAKNDGKKMVVTIAPVIAYSGVFSSRSLKKLSDFHFANISTQILAKSQLPLSINGIECPKEWIWE